MLKKISLIVLIFIILIAVNLLYRYYRIPVYTFDAEAKTLIRNEIVYKPSSELVEKYQSSEIKPVYERAVGRLKGDNPLWFKTFIYKFEGISEEEAFLVSSPFMNIELYERAGK